MPEASLRSRAFARMKLAATGLLLLAAAVYVLAVAMAGRHPAWGYLAAFAEAAMIGAIADWFAVVAMFRHPLGLPIPHTAIIPRNKKRIGENLAEFICRHFLSTQQVLGKIREFSPGRRLAEWLATPQNAQVVGRIMTDSARYGLNALDDSRLRHFIQDAAISKLEQIDLARTTGLLLDTLTENRRHQALLDEVLTEIGVLLADEKIQEKIGEVVSGEFKLLRFKVLGVEAPFDKIVGTWSTAKIVARLSSLIGEMGQDPQHPLRLRFDGFVAGFIDRLKQDPAFRLKGEQLKQQLLKHPALAEYLAQLWHDVLAWLNDDLDKDNSTIRLWIADAALSLGYKLGNDLAMQNWIDEQIISIAPQWIDRHREDIRRYIAERVDAWSTDELVHELELNIGKDLQFIRINGTLVGGCIGLLIYAVTLATR